MNNVLQLSFSILFLSAYITAQNTGNINVSLETVFEFNRKDKYNDLRILDDIQAFINNVRQGLLASPNTKKKHKFRHSGNIVMNADAEEDETVKRGKTKSSRRPKTTKPKPELRTNIKSDRTIKEKVKALGGQKKKTEAYMEKQLNHKQIKPLINLFAMIIRSIDDSDLRSLINIAHNETKKFKDHDVRRAMSESLTVLKETPIDSIKDFFTKISHEHHNFSNSPQNPYYKLNTAFENFFSELEWILRQMDPDSASLLTVLLHDLEKIFINEIEKTRLKSLSDTNVGVFRKLRKNPYMIESKDDSIVDIVKDALKSIVKDNYSNLDNKDKNWVRTKLKPFWENVRKFFETSSEVKSKRKKHSTTTKKEGWSARQSNKKFADSSVSTDSSSIEISPATLTVHLSKKVTSNKKHSGTERKRQSEKKKKHTHKTVTTKSKEEESAEALTSCSVINKTTVASTISASLFKLNKKTTTATVIANADSDNTMTTAIKRKKSKIYKATSKSGNRNHQKKKVTASDLSGEELEIEHDEIEEANRKYAEKQGASMQHRFRVLGGYNKSVIVTRTTLKQAKNVTKYARTDKNVKSRAQTHIKNNLIHKNGTGNINKTTQLVLLLESIDPDSYEAGKPSRTSLLPKKLTKPYKNVKVYVGARKNIPGKINMSRPQRHDRAQLYHPKIKTDLDTFEEASYESDTGIELDGKPQESIPNELIKRIYHIEEKIDNIEKLIINEKSSTRVVTPRYNSVRPITTVKTTTKVVKETETQRIEMPVTKTSLKTTTTMKSPEMFDDDKQTEENELDQPTARAHIILQSQFTAQVKSSHGFVKRNHSVTSTVAYFKKLMNTKTSENFTINTQKGKIPVKDGVNLTSAATNINDTNHLKS